MHNIAKVMQWLGMKCIETFVIVGNKIEMARKPGKKRKENPVVYTGEGKR